jgi:hypothetical protein
METMRHCRRVLLAGAILLACGCALPIDVLGEEQIVKDQSNSQGSDSLADDRIEDKHPQFDPTLTVQETISGCPFPMTLNKSGSVTKLDVIPFPDAEGALGQRLFPGYVAAAAALGHRPILPSMELVNAALKPFDDGLYAAVELGAEDGSGGSPIDKRALLNDLLTELLTRAATGAAAEQPLAREAAVSIGAAFQLGGGQPSPSIASDVATLIQRFHADAFESRPIGFYSWTPALSAIFQQDRLLQSPDSVRPSFGAFAATAVALNGNPSLAPRYGQVLNLYAGLTNPFFDRSVQDLLPLAPDGTSLGNLSSIQGAFGRAHPETAAADPACAAHLAFLPASDSPETRLFRALHCNGSLPPSANLLDVLIQAITSGAIDLTPTASSGWYDRQLYALETLLVPDRADEKDHLFLTHRYKQKLVETFKTLITETRETHVKQLGSSATSGSVALPPIDVYPVLPVEPFPTFYLRTARAYAFVRSLLTSVLGPGFLSTAHRVLEGGGAGSMPLQDELTDKITLLYGLHVLSAASIGMRPGLTSDEATAFPPAADATRAQAWLDGWHSDADVVRDPRVIVPIDRDPVAGTTRYWAVIGTTVVKIAASFYPGFEPKVVSGCAVRSFVDTEPYLLTGDTVEVTRPASASPLTRDEFRALCNRAQTHDAIVQALENP